MNRPVATLRCVLALAACVAVTACQSTSAPNPSAFLSTAGPGLSSTATTPPPTATPSPALTPVAPSAFPPPPTPPPTPATTAATVPPKPTGVTFTTDSVELPARSGTDEVTYQVTHTVRWEEPRTEDVEIKVYGVTACLSEPSDPSPGTSGPCLVERTRLPAGVMALAATAPAAAGEISWIAPHYYDCAGPPVGPDGLDYQAIVLAAYNEAGHSIFAIADPGEWWRAAPDDIVC